MINTRILVHEFDYVTPGTLQEALQLVNEHGEEAKVIAGGTDLVVQMKQEIISPSLLISIAKLEELRNIKEEDAVTMGAAVRLCDALNFFKKDERFAALSDALGLLAEVQVRNMGTLGGNLCNASPAADSAPPLLVFDAQVRLESIKGQRSLSLEDFFKGVNKTDLSSNELMIEIQIPFPRQGTGSAFMKSTRVGADISKISCALMIEREGEVCASCRIAFGAVAPVPMRAKEAEAFLKGKKVDEALLKEAGDIISGEINPITDIRSTAEYRKEIAKVLFRDVFHVAWKRAGGQG